MRKRMISLLALILLVALATSCVGGVRGMITGSRQLSTRTYEVSDFDQVTASYAFQVQITRGNNFGVVITADDNLFSYVVVEKRGSQLRLGLEQGYSYRNTTLRAQITMPALSTLELSGASRGTLSGFDSDRELRVTLSGAATLDGSIRAGNMRFQLSGASRATLSGNGQDLTLNGSGASNANLANLPVNNANVELSGGTQGQVNVRGRLDVTLSGASQLIYSGNPQIGRSNISGGSQLRSR